VAFAVILAGLFFLPLISVFRHAGVGLAFKALVVALLVLSAARPAIAVVALAVLLPLALAIQLFLGPQPVASVITEALLLSFASGAALRFALPVPGVRDRLGRPALVLGAVIAASAVVALAADQAAGPSRDVLAEVWRQINGRFLFVNRPFSFLHSSVRWLSVLALAVFVERAIRSAPALAPIATRMFLAGGAAAASFAALRFATILLEGRVAPTWVGSAAYVLREVRITALHADPNAAGSYFALFLVPALVIGLRRRNPWLLLGVCPLVGLAFLLAQSRAALLAVGVIPALMALVALVKSRRYLLAAGVILLVPVLGLTARIVTGSTHAPLGRAAVIRQEMALVALDMTRDHPAFGVGIGRFLALSRYYITDEYPVLRRWAPLGQNAHNNFLQILAELGAPAFLAFLWLVVPAARRWPWEPPSVSERDLYASALAAGLATFLLSAVFGHPLLVVQVAAAFFLALGLTAALLPEPAGAGRLGGYVAVAALVAVALTLPLRLREARAEAGEESGVGAVAGTLDGVAYRIAEPVSSWPIEAQAETVTLPLRWDAPAPADCRVDILLDGRLIDRARPDVTAWMPVRFRLPPASSPVETRTIQLVVPDDRCRLLVGPVDVED
jgi:O-antigen ligase